MSWEHLVVHALVQVAPHRAALLPGRDERVVDVPAAQRFDRDELAGDVEPSTASQMVSASDSVMGRIWAGGLGAYSGAHSPIRHPIANFVATT